MTAVEFHVNQPDKLHYACRLLRKAYRSGAKAVVIAEPELLQQLDQQLWLLSPTEFLPHCSSTAAAHTVAATPIVLASQIEDGPADGVLINLGQAIAPGFERFERVIEIASSQEEDRLAARARWKYYQERGYALKRHEIAATDQRAA
jgi:DNA polymerase III subunit chi